MATNDVTNLPSEDEEFDTVSAEQAAAEAGEAKPTIGDTIAPESTEPEKADMPQEPANKKPFKSKTAPLVNDITPDVQPVLASKPQEVVARKPMWRPTPQMVVIAVLGIAVVVLGLLTWTFYSDKQNLSKEVTSLNANPQAAVQKQTDQIIASVGRLMQLPTGETPTVAAVSDAAAAKQQSSFFNQAQNGDKVLMYVKAGEAILYRPSTNKIILVAPLTFNSTTGSTGSTTSGSSTTTKTTGTSTTSNR